MTDNEIYVYYILAGDFDPIHITNSVGLQPTQSWRQGDAWGDRGRKRPENAWRVDSPLPPSAGLEDHLRAVLDLLRPGWAALRDLGRTHEATIECAVYARESAPSLPFPRDVVAAIAELNSDIDIDYYDWV